jgi:hypothetical protein
VAELVSRPDWRTASDPDVLLNVVWPRPPAYPPYTVGRDLPPAVARRLRLFGCASARMVWDVLPTDLRSAVSISEQYADGRATWADLAAARVRRIEWPVSFRQHAHDAAAWASAVFLDLPPHPSQMIDQFSDPQLAARSAAKALASRAAGRAPAAGHPAADEWHATWTRAFFDARRRQAEFVRDIFPPPGYAPHRPADWRTSTVVLLARQMDASGDFSAAPILADALQDAGCDDAVVLGRCRAGSGVHCRGNWVVDLVLERE